MSDSPERVDLRMLGRCHGYDVYATESERCWCVMQLN